MADRVGVSAQAVRAQRVVAVGRVQRGRRVADAGQAVEGVVAVGGGDAAGLITSVPYSGLLFRPLSPKQISLKKRRTRSSGIAKLPTNRQET